MAKAKAYISEYTTISLSNLEKALLLFVKRDSEADYLDLYHTKFDSSYRFIKDFPNDVLELKTGRWLSLQGFINDICSGLRTIGTETPLKPEITKVPRHHVKDIEISALEFPGVSTEQIENLFKKIPGVIVTVTPHPTDAFTAVVSISFVITEEIQTNMSKMIFNLGRMFELGLNTLSRC